MANWYQYSAAAGANDGTDWANAHTTLAASATADAAGDAIWVADDTAETAGATKTITSSGTLGNPVKIICARRSGGSVPPVSADLRTTGSVTTTGAFQILIHGSIYVYGLIFASGTGATAQSLALNQTTGHQQRFKSCTFKSMGTTGGGLQAGGSTAQSGSIVCEDCTLEVASTASGINLRGSHFFWRGGSIVGATVPATLVIFPTALVPCFGKFVGANLSAIAGTLVGSSTGRLSYVSFEDCKLHASVTVSAAVTDPGHRVDLIRCDSGDTHYRNESHQYAGIMTTETTIVRTGGASEGGTAIAWKIVTSAGSSWSFPFESLVTSIVVTDAMYAALGKTFGDAITVGIEGIWGGGAVPLNDEIWIEALYPGTSGFPLGLFATSTKADILAAGANIPSSSETWGGSTTKFKMSVTITPVERGPIRLKIKAAKVSSTFYVCPEPVVS